MLKRFAAYFFIVFGLAALAGSTSRRFMQFISETRDGDKWWCAYPCLHGDLVSMSYLDFVPQFNPVQAKEYLKRANHTGTKKTVLVIHGDSNTWHLADSNFADVSKLYYINRTNGGYYHIDTAPDNILVIEVGERYLRSYFEGLSIFDEIKDTGGSKPLSLVSIKSPAKQASLIPGIKPDYFFNEYINQNLQCNLFNYNFIMPMFEYKAALNYYLFNRASGDVVISNDRKFLFLKETVTTTDQGSSYSPVSNEEIAKIVSTLNTIYDHYKQAGFREVYFSVIPNTATIVQPEGYNGLIPRLQGNPALRMKIIDIYSDFKNSKDIFYFTGDTHWNMKGKQMWVDKINEQLISAAGRP